MMYKYSSEVNIVLIKLRKGQLHRGEQEGNIIIHYDKDEKPIEIEILNASKSMFWLAKAIIANA